MVGKIIRQERIKQKIKSKDLAEAIGVDTGHLSHIEKGIRNPSKPILAKICKELNLSYQFMLNVAQNSVAEDSESYDVTNFVPYKKVLYAENFSLIDCPENISGVSLVTKMIDDSMEPEIKKDSLLYVNYTSVLDPKDICIATYHDKIIVREFLQDGDNIVLKAKNSKYDDIILSGGSALNIIGKILL